MRTLPVSGIIKQFGPSHHLSAASSLLHDSIAASDLPRLVSVMSICIENVADWMETNTLKMNYDKTAVIRIGTRSKLKQVSSVQSLRIAGCHISFADKVRNRGVFLDSTLSFDVQNNHLWGALYLQLRRLSQIRQHRSTDAADKLAGSFILSRLDYCNAPLGGLPDDTLSKLQRIQNCAARLVLRKSKRESSHSLLRALHWLPVRAVMEFKITTYYHHHLLSETMPSYLSGLLTVYTLYNTPISSRFSSGIASFLPQ